MKQFYQKYQTEIWGVVGIIIPAVPFLLTTLMDVSKDSPRFKDYILYALLVAVLQIATIYIYKRKIKKFSEDNIVESKLTTFKDILNAVKSEYWYYGMSGEEIQKEVNLIKYLSNATILKKIKIILLHPDCKEFKDRLMSVHASADIDKLIERKKTLTLSLLHTLNALPNEVKNKIEVRFTQSYPIWILQFINSNTERSEVIDKLFIKIHLPNRHSNESPIYEVERDNNLFKSFEIYFENEWEKSLRIDEPYTIPNIYETNHRVKVIVLDFDGVIVNTQRLKESILFKTLSLLDNYNQHKHDIFNFYIENRGRSRLDYIKYAIRTIHSDGNIELENKLLSEYNSQLSKELENVKSMPYVEQFCLISSKIAKLYIVSTAVKNEIEIVLKNLGISEYITDIYDTNRAPKSQSIYEIRKKNNCAINDMVFVGDSMEDVLAANETGVPLYLIKNDQNIIQKNIKGKFIDNLFELSFYI